MKPTKEEVQVEIKKLKEMKPKVRRLTGFGDDNHKAIEVQIRVLQGNLSADEIYDRWDMDDYLCENGIEAREWLDEGGEPPSGPDGWESLVQE